jgi:hypothetical protein
MGVNDSANVDRVRNSMEDSLLFIMMVFISWGQCVRVWIRICACVNQDMCVCESGYGRMYIRITYIA